MFPYPLPWKFCLIWSTGYGFYYQKFTEVLISLFSPQILISRLTHLHFFFLQCSLSCLYPDNLFPYFIFVFGYFLFEVDDYFYTLTFELFPQHVNHFIVFRFSN